ncbi:MAG: hypothetical protein SX243_24825 [Acidobacteriota bacterium]|nr:hypothetical protein [Acidobacteriota bacterium]
MKLSIYILSIVLATFALAGVVHAEEPAAATTAVHAELPQAPLFTAQPTALGTPNSEAKNPGTEGYACSATTTCPGSVRFNIPPYQISCQGYYDCYSVPGSAVVCDGFGKECFPG